MHVNFVTDSSRLIRAELELLSICFTNTVLYCAQNPKVFHSLLDQGLSNRFTQHPNNKDSVRVVQKNSMRYNESKEYSGSILSDRVSQTFQASTPKITVLRTPITTKDCDLSKLNNSLCAHVVMYPVMF